jgi:hypothetical protein
MLGCAGSEDAVKEWPFDEEAILSLKCAVFAAALGCVIEVLRSWGETCKISSSGKSEVTFFGVGRSSIFTVVEVFGKVLVET